MHCSLNRTQAEQALAAFGLATGASLIRGASQRPIETPSSLTASMRLQRAPSYRLS